MKILEYTSLDQFEIEGKGKVFVIEYADETIDRDSNDLIGSKMVIDNNEYTVKAIESHLLAQIKTGQKIGILV